MPIKLIMMSLKRLVKWLLHVYPIIFKTMNKPVIVFCLLILTLFSQPTEDEVRAQQNEASMKRTACLVLSRYHSNTQKDVIEGVVN